MVMFGCIKRKPFKRKNLEMNIYKVELAGPIKKGNFIPDVFATIHRPLGDSYINITIRWADGHEKNHSVQAGDPDDLWSMTECLQETVDGHQGTNSMIHDYYRLLENFAD